MPDYTSRPSEINKDIVEWAKKILPNVPDDENYYKMISGVEYDPMVPSLIRDRILSSERAADYQLIRLRDFGSLDLYHRARSEYLSDVFGSVGEGVNIEPPFYVDYGFNIKLGKNFYTNFNATFLDCSIIDIGDNVMFGPNVTISTASHPLEAKLRADGAEFAKPIKIGNNVWIGANVVVLPGVTIGDNSVVAAGAVVSRDVPESTLVVGVPARVTKKIEQ